MRYNVLARVIVCVMAFGLLVGAVGAQNDKGDAKSVSQPTRLQNSPASVEDSSGERAIVQLKGEFDNTLIAARIATILCGIAGFLVFRRAARSLIAGDQWIGLAVAALSAPLVFAALLALLLGPDAHACWSAELISGSRSSDFDNVCRLGREGVVNAFGSKSAWALLFGDTVVGGMVQPLSAGVVRLLGYVSAIAGAVVIYLLLRLASKMLIEARRR